MERKDETLLGLVAGIMKTGGGGKRDYEVIRVGKVITSENTVIITYKRLLFVTVPLPGAESTAAGVDIPMWQWIAAKKKIAEKAKEMTAAMSIADIMQSNPKNFAIEYNDIEKVKFSKFTRSVKIIRRNDKNLKYSIRDKKDFDKAKEILGKYFSE